MFKKIANIGLLNLSFSLINFFSNFIIVKLYGVGIFGEFATYSAFIALGALIFAVLPPSFSILKIQDDANFQYIYCNFYLAASFFYVIFLFLISVYSSIKIPLWISIIYSISLVWQNYFDVIFQSKNRIENFFWMLNILAFIKVVSFFSVLFFDLSISFENLIFIAGLAQFLVLLPYLYIERFVLCRSIKFTHITFKFIKNEFVILKNYYLNLSLKRVQENISIIFFSPFISKEDLGIFSLFIKVMSFVNGFSRVFESFFYNRLNLYKHFDIVYSKSLKIGLVFQIFFIFTGFIYLYILLGKMYLFQLVFLSFLFPFFTKFVLARSYFLSRFENTYLNYASLVYIVVNILCFLYIYLFTSFSLNAILIVYFLSNSLSCFYLIERFGKISND